MVKLSPFDESVLTAVRIANDHGQWYESIGDQRKQAMEVLASHGFVEQVTHMLFDITPAGRAWLAAKEKEHVRTQ